MTEPLTTPAPPPVYATVESLEAAWRPMADDAEYTTAAARISAAHTVIRAELATAGMPTIEALIDLGRLTQDVVAFVVHDMARVSMQDAPGVPSGASAVQYTTGPFSQQFSFDGSAREGSVRLSKQNRRMLGLGQPYLYSIDLI